MVDSNIMDGHIYVINKTREKKLALNSAAIQARASGILKMCIL